VPSAVPTCVPSASPSSAVPSVVPTSVPSAVPTDASSASPSSAVPSAVPTSVPSVEPTILLVTEMSLKSSLVLDNVNVSAFMSVAGLAAFESAIEVSSGVPGGSVHVLNVSSLSESSSFSGRRVQQTGPIEVLWELNVVIENLGQSNATVVYESIVQSLQVSFEGGTFLSTLRDTISGIFPAGNATVTAFQVIERSINVFAVTTAPTESPTPVPSNKSGLRNTSLSSRASATWVIVVIVVFGSLLLGAAAYMLFRLRSRKAGLESELVVIEFEREGKHGDIERSSHGAGGSDNEDGSDHESSHKEVRIFGPDLDSPDFGDLYQSQSDEFTINSPASAMVGSKVETFQL
jgi:hypothetical protein